MFFKKKKEINNDRYENEREYLVNLVNNISNTMYDVSIDDGTTEGKIHFKEKNGDLHAYIAYSYGDSSAGCTKVVTFVTEHGEKEKPFDAKFLQSKADDQYLSCNQKAELSNLIHTEIQNKIQNLEQDRIKLKCEM